MAVTGIRPGFWLQHASNEADQLVAFADELELTPAGRPGTALGPLNPPDRLRKLYERARGNGDAVLDPHGHLLDRTHTARARKHFPWLALAQRPSTQEQWEAWIRDALSLQQSASLHGTAPPPSFYITPSPLIAASRGTAELYAVLDAATAVSRAQPPGTDCWLGVSVDREYLREQPHLTRLANAMLATRATGFVFRASHSQLAPVDDLRYLSGLREVVQACSANGVRVFLPGSGWLGWLSMAWGAWGFSGGMAGGSWVDRVPGPMNKPQVPSQPYFESQLLRSLRWQIHQQLAQQPGYQPCACIDCVQMGANHDLALAKRHQLRQANIEGQALVALPASSRSHSIRLRLELAVNFRESLPSQLQARVSAGFLDRWLTLL
jgi:hypothetical protein